MLSLKIVFIIDKIDLHACGLNGSYLYNKGMVSVVDNQIHAG